MNPLNSQDLRAQDHSEENLERVPITLDNPELYENIRQRLPLRDRFQVSFAKSRLTRYIGEIKHFPEATIRVLTDEVFQYLNPPTIQEIEAMTPTASETTLESLLTFFKLENYISSIT